MRLRSITVLGAISAGLYLLIAVIYWTDAMFHPTLTVQALLYATIAVLTILYFAGIPLVQSASFRSLMTFTVIIAFIGFVALPFDSTDPFYYIAQGWEQSHYGANPYTHVLRDIPNSQKDPMIATRWMALNGNPWLDEPIPYGFAFALLTRGIAWLGHGNWWLTFWLFELFTLFVHGGVGLLLWKTARLLPNADPKLLLYLYAWSPLVLLQYLVNLHNDILMGALILLAFYFFCSKRPAWMFPAIVLAGFVKYAAFALIPLAAIRIFRQYGWKSLFKGLAIAAGVTILVSYPYVGELRAIKFHAVVSQFADSIGSMHGFLMFSLKAFFTALAPLVRVDLGLINRLCRRLLWLSVAAIACRELYRSWNQQYVKPADVATRWTLVMFAVIFVGSSQFYSWYIGMMFPLAVVGVGTSALCDAVLLLSGTHMFGFTSLRANAFVYFLLATALPISLSFWRRLNRTNAKNRTPDRPASGK